MLEAFASGCVAYVEESRYLAVRGEDALGGIPFYIYIGCLDAEFPDSELELEGEFGEAGECGRGVRVGPGSSASSGWHDDLIVMV